MVGIYVRQSIDKKDSISVESQIDFCTHETHNEPYTVFSDRGYSGKNTSRPAFERLMQGVNNGTITKVICYKVDRVSRNLNDFAGIYENFEKKGVEFVSCMEKFDTSTPIGKAMLSIIMVFAQMERETIAARIKDNYYQRGKAGMYLGGPAPFGFDKIETSFNGKKTYMLKINSDTAIIKEMYRKYNEENLSLGKIAIWLNTEMSTGREWSSLTVQRTLRNTVHVRADIDVYKYLKSKGAIITNDVDEFCGVHGLLIYGDRKSKTKSKFTDLKDDFVQVCMHEGIIDSVDWLKSQYRLDENKQVGNYGKGTHTWLSGIIKCGYCNHAISVVNGQHNGKLYITCGGRINKTCHKRKKTTAVPEIEKRVEHELLNYMKGFSADFSKTESKNNLEVNKYKIEIIKTEKQIQAIIDKIMSVPNTTVAEYLHKEVEKLDTSKKILESNLSELEYESAKPILSEEEIQEYISNWHDYNIEEKKNIARLFIKKVNVTDEEIHIKFRS